MKISKGKDLEYWMEYMRKQNEETQEKIRILKVIENVILAHFTLEELREVVKFVEVILTKKKMNGEFDYLKNIQKDESQ